MKISLTDTARDKVLDIASPFRLYFLDTCCHGSALKVSKDEKSDDDTIYNIDGVEILLAGDFLKEMPEEIEVEIDYKDSGLRRGFRADYKWK